MKYSLSVLALGATFVLAPVAHAQIYIRNNFDDNNLANDAGSPTGAFAANVVSGNNWGNSTTNFPGRVGITGANSTENTTSRNLSQDITVTANSVVYLQYRWSAIWTGDTPAQPARQNYTFTASLGNYSFTANNATFTPTSGNPVGGLVRTTVSFATAGTYTLNFAASSLGRNRNLTVDDVFVRRVPGPLPVLGAFVAFGWSRKLRSKIREAQA